MKRLTKARVVVRRLGTIKDPEDLKSPPLGVSIIVAGREKRGTRVYFFVDPKGGGVVKKIAEQIVLHRWRRQNSRLLQFSGARLGPKVWRTLPMILDRDPGKWPSLSEAEIKNKIKASRESMRDTYAKLPDARVLRVIFDYCGGKRLENIVSRHTDPMRAGQFGTPDLFIYAISKKTGKPQRQRFLEVKKPEEPLKPIQKDEIYFLQSLGLQAHVVRLIERGIS